ncbi:MAG: Zn-dependent protease [Bacteroidetes bacterium GWA2_31_9b]|nr:MAG: Zn-dependent protease [Bacteroidetes bacterium GWA2_31_9b]
MKTLYTIFLTALLSIVINNVNAQFFKADEPFAHTFSIVAIDTATGEMAVGVQSHWFSVGSLVSWGKSGVGVVATQSFVNPAYGPEGLKLISEGKTAEQALQILVEQDPGRDYRQVAFLDTKGNVSTYTGKLCVQSASHIIGENFSVQANMMLNNDVVPAMAKIFRENASLPLAERVVKTMQAAQDAGGDIRGKQSAVLLVFNTKTVKYEWMDKKIDLRVDDNTAPLIELERLLNVFRAYEHMNNGDLAIEAGDMTKALDEYATAEKMFPDNLEMKYWKAVALANKNKLNDAIPIFMEIFEKDSNWKELTKRLPASGLLNISDEDMLRIIGK